MNFLIVTGMSGSGKSSVINALEDIGFYCIDNMPPQLIPKFGDICVQSGKQIDKVAIVTDIRGGELFLDLDDGLDFLKSNNLDYKVMFLDAENETLLRRYKETRRRHPLDEKACGSLNGAIEMERNILSNAREISDYYINTTGFSLTQLKETVNSLFLENPNESMSVQVVSFGFKYGGSPEFDLVFDVRCLPNPFYVESLKKLTGLDAAVSEYVMKFEQSRELAEKLGDLIDFLIPLYVREGKSQLVIAFGCTGGKHRSITFAELMAKRLAGNGVKCRVTHRDIDKGR